jgi:hypothetical protein
MQDLLCDQNMYVIKMNDSKQIFFFPVEVQVTKKCVRDSLHVPHNGRISCNRK